jgi:methyltransferase (TIGR00027 family)
MKKEQPSKTAQSIAAHYLLLSYDPVFGRLIPREAIKPLRWFLSELSGAASLNLFLYRIPFMRTYFRWVENKILPGFSLHVALRKKWMESQVINAIVTGVKQVIVLGAGFDTLTYRFHHRYPEINWIEIDHFATQRVKKQALIKHGKTKDNLYLTSADFTEQNLTEVLRSIPAFQTDKPTIYIAEGLLMYLPESEVLSIFKQLHTLHNGTCRVVGTAIEPNSEGDLVLKGNSNVDIDPNRLGEPLLWGTKSVDLPALLNTCRFQSVLTKYTDDMLKDTYPHIQNHYQLPRNEYLFSAQ